MMPSKISSIILKKDCIEEKFTAFSKENEKYSIKLKEKKEALYEVFFYEYTETKYCGLIFLSKSHSKSQDIYAKKPQTPVFRTNEIISII